MEERDRDNKNKNKNMNKNENDNNNNNVNGESTQQHENAMAIFGRGSTGTNKWADPVPCYSNLTYTFFPRI